mmetsp:Transcript_68796/g.164634  ORF Transcript_68796/g.164634 Transcript_68796/m.164634 type:complete len:328 (-) Transcript_68796:69-1052(-)
MRTLRGWRCMASTISRAAPSFVKSAPVGGCAKESQPKESSARHVIAPSPWDLRPRSTDAAASLRGSSSSLLGESRSQPRPPAPITWSLGRSGKSRMVRSSVSATGLASACTTSFAEASPVAVSSPASHPRASITFASHASSCSESWMSWAAARDSSANASPRAAIACCLLIAASRSGWPLAAERMMTRAAAMSPGRHAAPFIVRIRSSAASNGPSIRTRSQSESGSVLAMLSSSSSSRAAMPDTSRCSARRATFCARASASTPVRARLCARTSIGAASILETLSLSRPLCFFPAFSQIRVVHGVSNCFCGDLFVRYRSRWRTGRGGG